MSPGWWWASTSSSAAASATFRASGPLADRPARSGIIGASDTRPRLGLIPTRPHAAAGIRIDPAPSLPWASGASPAATAAAAPPLDPPADLVTSQGVRAGGATVGSV